MSALAAERPRATASAPGAQGTIQGALYGAKALAQGIGPLIFAALFSACTRSDSPLPYFPGARAARAAARPGAARWGPPAAVRTSRRPAPARMAVFFLYVTTDHAKATKATLAPPCS